MKARDYRARAREQLGNSIFGNEWVMALVVCLIADLLLSVASFMFVLVILIAGPLAVGQCMAFTRQAREGKMKIEDLFGGFSENFSGRLLLGLLESIFIFLWSLLFLIPGIVKSYSYSMAFYISMDHPEYDWKQCIDESRRMMNGRKMRLFCLDLSFLGWMIVGILTCGIGLLWVAPYMEAAHTQFYLDAVQEA